MTRGETGANETSAGENKRERYQRRYGGVAKVAAMEEQMIARGLVEGIKFSYGGNVSQTTDSHRLIEKAKLLGGEIAQIKVVEKLFRTYFEEEGDPGSFDLLSRDAEAVGVMTKDEVSSIHLCAVRVSTDVVGIGSRIPQVGRAQGGGPGGHPQGSVEGNLWSALHDPQQQARHLWR
jgi:hypothetical protein